jgi:starch synthase
VKALFCTAEIHPFSRVGGLAEFSNYLTRKLAALGVEVGIVTPLYRQVSRKAGEIVPFTDLPGAEIILGSERVPVKFYRSTMPDSDIPVYFVECDQFFGRDGIYTNPSDGKGFTDNHRRYGAFQLAIMRLLESGAIQADLVHVNDHHTALIPAMLKAWGGRLATIRSILTLHNVMYQIDAEAAFANDLGIGSVVYAPDSPYVQDGRFNFLKTGILWADKVVAVSMTYADETRKDDGLGYGLSRELSLRGGDYAGILNGVDYSAWNPERDDLIPSPYSASRLSKKQVNKEELLALNGLDHSNLDMPVIGMITRLTDRKGFDMMSAIIDKIMTFDLFLVMLGTGEAKYHRLFESVKMRFPHKFGLNLSYSNRMAHLILAGSDFSLLPSRFEPCGQHQMYAMRFGSVPIAHATGGLADTIRDVEAEGGGWGFTYSGNDPQLLLKTIWRAVSAHKDKKAFKKIVKRAMEQRFTWDDTAQCYYAVYDALFD